MALLILGAYSAIYFREWFTEKGMPANITAAQLHFAFGFCVCVFVIMWIVWRICHRPPPMPPLRHGRTWARAAHWLLYFFVIAMPITGYMETRAVPEYLLIVSRFQDTALYAWFVTGTLGLTWDQWRKPLSFFHFVSGGNIVWVLIALHTAAALYHQFHLRDRLMRRVWF